MNYDHDQEMRDAIVKLIAKRAANETLHDNYHVKDVAELLHALAAYDAVSAPLLLSQQDVRAGA